MVPRSQRQREKDLTRKKKNSLREDHVIRRGIAHDRHDDVGRETDIILPYSISAVTVTMATLV